jgi:DnaJ-like protein
MKNYYEILKLTKDSSAVEIKQRFKELAFENHPDVSENKNANEIFIDIYEAYNILSNPTKRAQYDIIYEKYVIKTTSPVQRDECIKIDIENNAHIARKEAHQKANTKYKEFIKELDCSFSVSLKADGKPFYYNMHKTLGISGGTGPMGRIKAKTISIPIPRSKKAFMLHQIGFLIKVLFLIILIIVWKYNLFPEYTLIYRIAGSAGLLLLGGFVTHLMYILNKTKSKCLAASTYFLVKKYRKNSYNRGFHPIISTTPVGIFTFIFRWLF